MEKAAYDESNMTRIKVSPKNLIPGNTDWARIDAISDEEVNEAALSDPDAQPPTPEALKKFQRVVDVKTLRENLSLTQEEFAETFHLSLTMVKEWERAIRTPDPTAQTLLRVIAHNPKLVQEALAA